MKNGLKKSLCTVLAALLMLFTAAACGTPEGGSSESGGASGKQSAPQASDGKQEEIVFWHHWTGDEAAKYKAIVDKFQDEYPNIKVTVLEGANAEKQLIAMSGGYAFDASSYGASVTSQWASSGALEPLDAYIEAGEIDLENFVPFILQAGQYNGKQYSIPHAVDSLMMFYNADILKECGYDTPPKTISEFQEFAFKATKTDDQGNYTRLGFAPDWPFTNPMRWPYIFGAEGWYDRETGTVLANTPETVESLEFRFSFYSGQYDNEKARRFTSGFDGTYMTPENPFFQGKLAASLEGEWFPAFLRDYAPDMNWVCAPAPYPDGKPELENAGEITPCALYMPANAKNKEAAFKLIQWLAGDTAQIEQAVTKGNLPSTISALESPDLTERAPELKPFVDIMLSGKGRVTLGEKFSNEYEAALRDAEELVYGMKKTPAEALADVQGEIEKLVQK